MKRNIILVALAIIIVGILICCNNNNLKKVDDITIGKSIYLSENGYYVPFIVLSHNYNGKTLLLRKEIINNRRISDYFSIYENSEVDKYLNSYYINLVDQEKLIDTTNIEVVSDAAIGFSGEETYTIKRKVFLLSCNELCFSERIISVKEGIRIKFFRHYSNRIAYLNGIKSSWWLRTPNTNFVSCTYSVGSKGDLASPNSSDQSGIRPAFCISGSLEVENKKDIIYGQDVIVLSKQYK